MPADADLRGSDPRRTRSPRGPQRAVPMGAYLKSTMACHGIRVPQVRALVHAETAIRPPASTDALAATAAALCRAAEEPALGA